MGRTELDMQVERGAPHVLVVEDEFLIGAMVADVLAEHGCGVHVAANAADALRYLNCGAPCDVLFTDINLPGSVDGAVLARLVRQLRPGLPVIYASGRFGGIGEFDAVDGAMFVAKPYNPEVVCALLKSSAAIARRGPPPTPPSGLRETAPASGCDSCRR